jgi:hypothetical protein
VASPGRRIRRQVDLGSFMGPGRPVPPWGTADGAQIVGDFLDVVGVADLEARLFVAQVRQCGLGALDLRGEQRLFADGAVEQSVD